MTTYELLQENWKKRTMIDTAQKKNAFAKNETLVIINEKARMHHLSYGQYVLAREQGKFQEDYGKTIKLPEYHRTAFCRIRKATVTKY